VWYSIRGIAASAGSFAGVTSIKVEQIGKTMTVRWIGDAIESGSNYHSEGMLNQLFTSTINQSIHGIR